MTSKVSARTSYASVGSRVHFWSSEDVSLLEFTSPIDREWPTSEVRINVCSTDFERRLHFGSFRLPCGAYGPRMVYRYNDISSRYTILAGNPITVVPLAARVDGGDDEDDIVAVVVVVALLLLLMSFVCVCVCVCVCVPQLHFWGSPLWVRFLRMWPFFNPTIKVGTFRLRGWCVLGVFFVASIHPYRTWTSGSFESVRWNACAHRLDLGLYSHRKEFWGEWSLNPC